MKRNQKPAEQDVVIRDQAEEIELGFLDGFLGMLLRAAYTATFQHFTDHLGEDALSPGSFTILTLISNNPGITQVEIGRGARRDKSGVTKALRGLEDAGLITRVRFDRDRRSQAAYLTEAGAEHQKRMMKAAMVQAQAVNEIVGEDRLPVLVGALTDIIEQLNTPTAEGAPVTRSKRSTRNDTI